MSEILKQARAYKEAYESIIRAEEAIQDLTTCTEALVVSVQQQGFFEFKTEYGKLNQENLRKLLLGQLEDGLAKSIQNLDAMVGFKA